MRSDRERLLDMLEAIERIEAQAAVIRWIEIIGEAAHGVTAELQEAHPEVPWRRMVALAQIRAVLSGMS